jgi:DNA-binding response OmpR family regulator
VKKLRSMATASRLPILFLTGSDEEDDIVRGFEVGANDYLVKPFHARELIARITRLLPRR